MADRVHLDDLALAPGKEARLARMLYTYGPGNGTLFVLPYDHGMEHGPIDFMRNPESADPAHLFELAIDGDFSAIATHYGVAARYFPDYAGEIPLVVKVSGKTNIPPDDEALSALDASVEDAVRIGADGIGYTLYVGSPSQDRDFPQLGRVRQACDRFGMPLIVWAYPRGRDVEAKGGRDSLYMVEYAARLAMEMGADVVKINVPKPRRPDTDYPDAYEELESLDEPGKLERVVRAARRTLVIFSGGSYRTDDEFLANVQMGMEAGASGLIAGRNVWQRPRGEALAMTEGIHDVLESHGE
ncbi:MAG: class I fructose-bisphosphate aldolase [Candidatus Bipolaricaulia bacterium]